MKYRLIIIGLIISTTISCQDQKASDFQAEIKQYDVSTLWTIDTFQTDFEGNISFIERQEPLGYIGNNYLRFYIHFISIIQNPISKTEYYAYGKTKVKNNICSFQGEINITESAIYAESDFPPLKEGYMRGNYQFFEDPKQEGSGVLEGNFETYFFINTEGEIKYNAISWISDGYKNNQFEGVWRSYKTSNQKICNWGDYRIPNSQELDAGCGEFSPINKNPDSGWEYYNLARGYPPDSKEVQEARIKENEKWWIEDNCQARTR